MQMRNAKLVKWIRPTTAPLAIACCYVNKSSFCVRIINSLCLDMMDYVLFIAVVYSSLIQYTHIHDTIVFTQYTDMCRYKLYSTEYIYIDNTS